jgi:hypothetical protein
LAIIFADSARVIGVFGLKRDQKATFCPFIKPSSFALFACFFIQVSGRSIKELQRESIKSYHFIFIINFIASIRVMSLSGRNVLSSYPFVIQS